MKKMTSKESIAILFDQYLVSRGGERYLKACIDALNPDKVFLLFADVELLKEDFPKQDFEIHWLNKLPLPLFIKQSLAFLGPWLFKFFDLESFDKVITISAKHNYGVRIDSPKHVAIILSPNRYLYDLYQNQHLPFDNFFTTIIRRLFKRLDREWFRRPDKFVFISEKVQKYWKQVYGTADGQILYPPVDFKKLEQVKSDKAILRQLPEKFQLLINPTSFNKNTPELRKYLENFKGDVVLIGESSQKSLKLPATPTYHELGWVSEAEKKALLKAAEKLIFLGNEDFGIAAAESLFLNTPLVTEDLFWKHITKKDLQQFSKESFESKLKQLI